MPYHYACTPHNYACTHPLLACTMGRTIYSVHTNTNKGHILKGRSMSNIDLSDNVLVKFPDHLLLLSDVVDLTHNRIKVVTP